GKPLRAGNVPIAAVEDRLHEGIAARDDVADHPDVGLERELLRAEARDQLDAERRELIAHRRIDIGVAAGDAMSRRLGDRGYAAHERAADPEDVEVRRHGGSKFYD